MKQIRKHLSGIHQGGGVFRQGGEPQEVFGVDELPQLNSNQISQGTLGRKGGHSGKLMTQHPDQKDKGKQNASPS